MENPNAKMTRKQAEQHDAQMTVLNGWIDDPQIGLRFMNSVHRAVLETYSGALGEHTTLQAALMAITPGEVAQVETVNGTSPALTTSDGKQPIDPQRI